MNKAKILVVPSWYSIKKNDQLGSFFKEQTKTINKYICECILVDVSFKGKKNLFYNLLNSKKKINDDGLLTYTYYGFEFIKKRKEVQAEAFYQRLKEIYKSISKKEKINLIIAHSYYPAGYASVKLGKEVNIPVIVVEHSDELFRDVTDRITNELMQYTFSNANRIICVSSSLKNSLMNKINFAKQIMVIPNMVNSSFEYAEIENRNNMLFVTACYLYKNKQVEKIIDAVSIIKNTYPNVILKILGNGPEKASLKKQVEIKGLQKNVVFYGSCTREKVRKEMQKSSVFVMVSKNETFGVAYIEALSCGLPVVASNNGGSSDIVNENNGIIVDSLDEHNLSRCMIYVANKDYDRKKISIEARKKYGEESFCNSYRNVVKSFI